MPLHYTIDAAQQLITITGEYADAGEWRVLLRQVLDDPRRRPGFAFLRDLREASTPVDAATVVGIIDVVRQFWPHLQPSRAAILTPLELDPAAFVAHALADAQEIPLRTFTSLDEALQWLQAGRRTDRLPNSQPLTPTPNSQPHPNSQPQPQLPTPTPTQPPTPTPNLQRPVPM